MSLQPGARLGPYDVLAAIGAGGMGEVYRAKDTKLNRDVALKALPDAFAQDAERMARFQREAQVLASLNHPNIAAIYGLEEADDTRALVLELVEGPTLADRIAQGPIPVDEALLIARQIAEALEAAHEQGIVHRDLKPANIKFRLDGTVKVLDFGLAKALEGEQAPADQANSPTLTAAASQMGVIIGTAAYMSPEQAKGKPVDKRTDVWAFGAVVYEILTARRAFEGEDVSDTLAFVLTRQIDWSALPPETPASVRRMLRRCLTREPKNRLADMSMARLDIDEADAPLEASDEGRSASVFPPTVWQRPATIAAMLVGTAVVASLAVWILTRPAPAPVTRMSIVLPQTHQRTNQQERGVAVSPTGTHVVYVANSQLYLRPLDQLEAQPLTGTEGSNAGSPFFSPDGQWIGFFSRSDSTLKKVALSGGAAVTLAEVASGILGATWGVDDTIVFGSSGTGIHRVGGAGGEPEVLVSVDFPGVARQPQMLPGSEAVLYTLLADRVGFAWDTAQIVVERVATGERTVVVEGGTDARYLPTGHLVYALANSLLAVPFDVDRLEVTGGPVPLVQGVNMTSFTGATNADVAQTGALVYLPGSSEQNVRTLVWVDRTGREDPLDLAPGGYTWAHVSPDGLHIALSTDGFEDNPDVWVSELARGTLSRVTTHPALDNDPVWTPDGSQLVFPSLRENGQFGFYMKASDGTGAVEQLLTSETSGFFRPYGWSPDARTLVFDYQGASGTGDIGLLSMDGDRPWTPLLETDATELSPAISPDGAWLAYSSDQTGRPEVYVERFPELGGRQQISTGGGAEPLWGPDGTELFYRRADAMMVVTVDSGPPLSVGEPEVLFEGEYFRSRDSRRYDMAPDGQRFLMIRTGDIAPADDPFVGLRQIHVVSNWFEELKARVPTGQ